MGQRLQLTCRHCHEEIAFNLGCGMILIDLAKAVAKKRIAVRREVAVLQNCMVRGSVQFDFELFWCKRCRTYHNRNLLQFDFLQDGVLQSYQATELCSKCKSVCEQVSRSITEQDYTNLVQNMECPSCQHRGYDVSNVLLWD